jgi:hypothetical protein
MHSVSVSAQDGQPLSFTYKRQQMQIVEIADHWRETGRWWDEEIPCDFYLVATPGGTFLLSRAIETDAWYAKPVQ